MNWETDYWTPEKVKAFQEEMSVCKGMRADGKDGKCIDPERHNLGCVNCLVAADLCEPDPLN